jgi:hypothetical protein
VPSWLVIVLVVAAILLVGFLVLVILHFPRDNAF